MPAKVIHAHKLKRHTYKNGTKVYFCTLPDCGYKVSPEFSLGKRSICNVCGSEFTLNEYAIRLAKPRCENCHRRKTIGNILAVPIRDRDTVKESEDIEFEQAESEPKGLKEKLFKSIDEIVSSAKDYRKRDRDDIL